MVGTEQERITEMTNFDYDRSIIRQRERLELSLDSRTLFNIINTSCIALKVLVIGGTISFAAYLFTSNL